MFMVNVGINIPYIIYIYISIFYGVTKLSATHFHHDFTDSGIVEVKFRQQQRLEMMHRLDEKLKELDQRILG